MNVIGYVRVSTRSQSYEIQQDQIKDYCRFKEFNLSRIFADKKSGKDMDRPEFQQMMDLLKDNPLDTQAVVVTKIDRVGRSLRDLLKFIDWLQDHNIGFVAFQNNIDTTTKEGRLFTYIMGALSEYERELILERTEYGRQRFLESGGRLGRKEKVLNRDEIKRQMELGVSIAKIAKNFKVSRGTIYNRLGGN